ncbi:MAG: hypothetical protein SPF72_11380 [Parabacteroides sp.]|nr:hypothetical protein [Parabacteroides sp.]
MEARNEWRLRRWLVQQLLRAFDEWTTLYDQVEQIYRDTEDQCK